MSVGDKYSEIAEFYDAMLPANPARDTFFHQLFRRYKVQRVLDCACGTGNDLLMFHSLGYSVCGSDISESMLRVAKRKLQQNNVKIPLKLIDFHELHKHYSSKFDAVVCLSNAINESEVDAQQAFNSMRSVLSPSGIIVFDQGQTDLSMKSPPRYVPEVNNRDLSRLYIIDYEQRLMTVQIFDFIHNEKNGKYDFHRSEFKIHIRLFADWEEILDGLNMQAEYYGDWQSSTYDMNNSKRLIIVAREKEK